MKTRLTDLPRLIYVFSRSDTLEIVISVHVIRRILGKIRKGVDRKRCSRLGFGFVAEKGASMRLAGSWNGEGGGVSDLGSSKILAEFQ